MSRVRSYYLDAIRVLACVMVIVMHSPMPVSDSSWGVVLTLVSYFTAPCIGLFFMVSGALLLPVELSTRDFLMKRLSKMLYPTLCWSLFYIGCNVVKGATDGAGVLTSLLALPFTAQGHGVLWFMYTLIGLYLLAPVVSPWLKLINERTLRFYLLLWGVTLCVPFLSLAFNIQINAEYMLFYFSGYAGYFLLGYYLHTYVKNLSGGVKKTCLFSVLGVLVVLVPPVLCKLFHWEVDFYSLFWYLSIGVATMCLFWFVLLRCFHLLNQSNRLTLALAELSKMSFGIYLVHIFIMRDILWHWSFMASLSVWIQIPVCSVLTLALSYGVVKLISKLPFSKYIIGA